MRNTKRILKNLGVIIGLSSSISLSYADSNFPSPTPMAPILTEYLCVSKALCGSDYLTSNNAFLAYNGPITFAIVNAAITRPDGTIQFPLPADSASENNLHASSYTPRILSIKVSHWYEVLNNSDNFLSSLDQILQKRSICIKAPNWESCFPMQGIDLQITANGITNPDDAKKLGQLILQVKQLINKYKTTEQPLYLFVTSEAIRVAPDLGPTNGIANTMVYVLNNQQVADAINYIQIKPDYNPGEEDIGTPAYLENIYNSWVKPKLGQNGALPYKGFPANKLLLGLPASPSVAFASGFYFQPDQIQQAISRLFYDYGHENFGGVMLWDATSDQAAGNQISNAVVQSLYGKNVGKQRNR